MTKTIREVENLTTTIYGREEENLTTTIHGRRRRI